MPSTESSDVKTVPEETNREVQIDQQQVQTWWNEFAETQPMRLKSLLRSINPELREDLVVIKVLGSAEETLSEIEGKLNAYFREKSGGKIKSVIKERGELSKESTPYTQQEKLNVLLKKYPELQDVIDKLELYL